MMVGRGGRCSLLVRFKTSALYKVGLFSVPASLPSRELLKQEGHLEEGVSSHLLKCMQGSAIPCLSCCVKLPHHLSISVHFGGLWE